MAQLASEGRSGMGAQSGAAMPRRSMCLLAGVMLAAGLTACQSGPAGSDGPGGTSGVAWTAPVFPLKLTVSPANAARAVEPAKQVIVTASGGRLTDVRVVAQSGAAVTGVMSADGSLWSARGRLAFGTTYAVVADAVAGKTTKRVTSSFTTATASKWAYPSVTPLTGETVGVGMPIMITFDHAVTDRAAAERQFQVHTSKPVVGSWYWLSDTRVHYRPQVYWPAYTNVTVDLNVAGVALGNGVYGQQNRRISFKVGSSVISTVSNASHSMTVVQDGKVLRTMPVSLGKASRPTASGTHLVMEKFTSKYFDSASFGLPRDSPDGYYIKVRWATRFTSGGQFVHAAPWSVGSQGHSNVSHGCVNVSTANGKWFYYESKRGDVVRVTGTPRTISPGDGWTDWNVPWNDYVKGSALS